MDPLLLLEYKTSAVPGQRPGLDLAPCPSANPSRIGWQYPKCDVTGPIPGEGINRAFPVSMAVLHLRSEHRNRGVFVHCLRHEFVLQPAGAANQDARLIQWECILQSHGIERPVEGLSGSPDPRPNPEYPRERT